MSRKKRQRSRRLMVLDTNVLMHDPSCLFRFHEHDVFIPMIVLEELDNNKRGHSEVARNARQASRTMEELVQGASRQEIEKGLHLPKLQDSNPSGGRLFFQTRTFNYDLPRDLPSNLPDNTILATVLALQMTNPDRSVVLVSKDINLRIKASALGITAEDYRDDQVLDDLSLLATGQFTLPEGFWERNSKNLSSWQKDGKTYYKITGPDVEKWYPNQLNHDNKDKKHKTNKHQHNKHKTTNKNNNKKHNNQHNNKNNNTHNREQNNTHKLLMD